MVDLTDVLLFVFSIHSPFLLSQFRGKKKKRLNLLLHEDVSSSFKGSD